MKHDDWTLPTGTLDTCRNGLEVARRLLLELPDKPKDEVLAFFFSYVTRPFYDCMWDGMKAELGHVIYNLSDLIPERQRRCFAVYPDNEKQGGWATLEDFREEWKSHYPQIPNLIPQLSGMEKVLLLT